MPEFDGLDIEFATKVLDFAQKHQEATNGFRHDQSLFWVDNDRLQNECGTAACLAGIACYLHPSVEMRELPHSLYSYPFNLARNDWEDYEDCGRRTLGLTDDQADWLFYTKANGPAIALLETFINRAKEERASA